MTAIRYVVGDATDPQSPGRKVLCHVCNDVGGWGAGFVLAVSRRWQRPEQAYAEWHAAGPPTFRLGAVQFVAVASDFWVANMIAQRDVVPDRATGLPPIRYDAVEQCLADVARFAREKHASVHMPRIGCGLAGGQWSEIEPIIERTLCAVDVPVFVYDTMH